MTAEAFGQLAANLAGITKEVVLHLLGEPLSHPDLDGILKAAAAVALPVNIVTNGVLLTGERQDLVLRPIVRQISVSLQSYGNNFPDQDPTLYVERIKRFTDRALIERPDLYVNLRFWDLEGSKNDETNHNQQLRSVIEKIYGFSWADVAVDVRRRKNHRLTGRLYLHFDSRFIWPDPANDVMQTKGFCHGLTGHFGIHADGTVVPCCLDHNADMPLGNAFTQSIGEVLSSPRAVAIREGFARGELVEDLCKRCGYISRFNQSERPKPARGVQHDR
jgi:MoaA/NifB/PqqE/SkfB family radical SAM enzyme